MPPQTGAASRRSLDVISLWALVITIALAFIVVTPSLSSLLATTKTFVLAAGAIITLALYILARLARGNIIFPPALLVGALWLPVIAYLLSAAFSGASFDSSLWGTALEPDTLGFMLVAAGLGTLTALIVRRADQQKFVLTIGAWALAAVAAIQIAIVLIGQTSSSISPTFSILGSFNDIAILMGLGVIAILITLRFEEVARRTKNMLLALGIAALFLLALANSALVWELLALVSLGLFVEAVMHRSGRGVEPDLDEALLIAESPMESGEGNHSLVMPLVVLAISLFFLIGGTVAGALANTFHINILNIRPSWQSTLSVVKDTYASSPVFGSGPGTFGMEWLKHRDASLNSTIFWNVDFASGIGFIPSSLATTGIAGALAWIVFLGLLIALGVRTLVRRSYADPYVRYVSILSFIGALYLFAIAVFDLPGTVMLALAFALAGLFISTTRYAGEGRQWGIVFSKSPRLGFLIVFSLTILLLASVVAAYTLVGRYVSAAQVANAGNALSAGNLAAAANDAQSSLSFAPSSAAYQIQAAVAAAELSQIAASTTMTKNDALQAYQAALSAGINAALTATSQYPNEYQNWLALGNLYAQAVPLNVSGAYDSAKTAYQKAQALNPTNPQIPYILAQLDIAHKDTKAAEADLKQAVALKQDYTPAIFLLSQLEVQDGNVKDALASALAAAYFTPNDPNILFQVGILYAASGDLANAAAALSAAVSANPQFANARYFLSAVYAKQGDLKNATVEMQAIADMSSENAQAVGKQLDSLKAGKNPFPANLLTITPAPVNS